MAGIRVKGAQVKPGVTGQAAQAIKVYVSENISEFDVLCVIGLEGNFLSVAKATPASVRKSAGPLFVADYDASAGSYTAVAVPWKIFTYGNTSGSTVGSTWYLGTNARPNPAHTAPDTGAAFNLMVPVATVLTSHATEGKVLIKPRPTAGPVSGQLKGAGSATSTLTQTGLDVDSSRGVLATVEGAAASVTRAYISGTTLTITTSANISAGEVVNYTILPQ
tara:strand:+ start:287 stop:949 length:663 start_codon:yes stop_codon:yes gene_type:complete